MFIPPAAVAMPGGAEVLAAIKDATHQQSGAPAAKPLDAPPPPGGVNAPLASVLAMPQRGAAMGAVPRGLPVGMVQPGTAAADAQRTFFKGGGAVRWLMLDGGLVDEDERLAQVRGRIAAANKLAEANIAAENERVQQQEMTNAAEQRAAQQAAADDARRRQMFGVPAGLPVW